MNQTILLVPLDVLNSAEKQRMLKQMYTEEDEFYFQIENLYMRAKHASLRNK